MKLIDLTGQRFGRWTVIRQMPSVKGRAKWLCRCDCGTERIQSTSNLRLGSTLSCGCIKREQSLRVRFGERHPPEYRSWCAAKSRCNNPNVSCSPNYSGRGIAMCARWSASFQAFFDDLGSRPTVQHSIERIDNGKGYWCGECDECVSNGQTANCRWATRGEQNRNTRRNITLTLQGRTACLNDWAKEYGIPRNSLRRRLSSGWTLERALQTPVEQRPWRRVQTLEATREIKP